MLALDPLIDEFDLYKDDLTNFADPADRDQSPMWILMGRRTDQRTADEITEGQTLRALLKLH